MKLSEIEDMWQDDCKINELELGEESLRSVKLHSKYYRIYNEENKKLIHYRIEFKKLKRHKWEYYSGKATDNEGKAFQLKILKNDIPTYLESDEDLANLEKKIKYQEQKVSTIKDIIGVINNRNWIIKNAIDWERYINGSI